MAQRFDITGGSVAQRVSVGLAKIGMALKARAWRAAWADACRRSVSRCMRRAWARMPEWMSAAAASAPRAPPARMPRMKPGSKSRNPMSCRLLRVEEGGRQVAGRGGPFSRSGVGPAGDLPVARPSGGLGREQSITVDHRSQLDLTAGIL